MVKYTKTYKKLRRPFKNSRITRIPRKMYARQSRQTFCKVCYDCHKPPEMYLSHRPKIGYGPDAVTVCPTLLNTRCPKCHNLGHTGGNCRAGQDTFTPKPKPKPYYTIRKYVPPSTTPTTSPTSLKTPTNIFSVLEDTNDNHEQNGNIKHPIVDVQEQMTIIPKPLPQTTLTYSQIVAMGSTQERNNAINDVVQLFKKNIGIVEKKQEQQEEKKEEREYITEEKEIEFDELKYIQKMSWADITEEDDFDEFDFSDSELNSMNILV